MFIRAGLFSFTRSPKINWDKLVISNEGIYLQWKKYLRFTKKHHDVFPISLATVNTDLVNLH